MKYSFVADTYENIENTKKRLEMSGHLVNLIKKTPKEIIDKIVYITQGRLYPNFIDIEIGIAEKLAIRAIAKVTGRSGEKIRQESRRTGDLGETARMLLKDKAQVTFYPKPLTVGRVYQTFDKIAKTSGSGSIDRKINLLANLLADATPREAKYIVRTVTGNLRLGIADMTVLDALAITFGEGRGSKPLLERAYNVSSDLGKVAKVLMEDGIEGLEVFQVTSGRPVRPMLLERLSSPKEILEKLGGKCIAEYKYDGERMQVHKDGNHILLFSRRLENISFQYPDAVGLIRRSVSAKNAILETECVAVNQETQEMRPFQDLMHRRRKHGVQQSIKEHPISLFFFDLVYFNGKDLTMEPLPVRRKLLKKIVTETEHVHLTKSILTKDFEELERFFEEAIEKGCEGLVCKSVARNSVYQAGSKGWLWIKCKRDYKSEMSDTVDLVIVGAFHGRGRRARTYGALLLASYDSKKDIFETVCKCGSGFTDKDLEDLPQRMKPHEINRCHARVETKIDAEIWFEPKIVLEVIGAEITLSPIHTCAINTIRESRGLAIRFPRFTGNYRLDKSAEDATTTNEILEMYESQLKKLAD